MVRWQSIVDSVWENIEAVVEEEYEDKDDEGEDAELDGNTNLRSY